MGQLVAVQSLSEVQEVQYQESTVLLVQHIGGEEDTAEVKRLHTASATAGFVFCTRLH